MNDPLDLALIAAAAIAAGAVNALAGGGTLISFPALLALGVPAVSANVTSTVALCPGYLGAALAQRDDLRGQKRRVLTLLPAGVIGGIAGGILLVHTEERLFRTLVPYLILAASMLIAFQDKLRFWIVRRNGHSNPADMSAQWTAVPVCLASVYGGYFGAGLSVIVLAVLALLIDDTLTRLNALKQSISFSVNTAAAVFFLFSGKVVWPAALVMAAGAMLGGILGGKFAGRIKPASLRWTVVVIGVAVGVYYLIR